MYKVLIIEDEFHIRQIIKDYFSLKGIEVVEATQGYEALNLSLIHISEPTRQAEISYAVFCLKKKKQKNKHNKRAPQT